MLASVGIGGRISFPAHGLDGFLPVDLSFTEVEHGGRRSGQNVLAKSVVSHWVNPLSSVFRFPGGFLEYRILQGGRDVNTFFQIFFEKFFRHTGAGVGW